MEAGLPGITGEAKAPFRSVWGGAPTGAFYVIANTQNAFDAQNVTLQDPIAFDASRCNNTYGKTAYVQPISCKVKWFIKYKN